jgi:hypothetical protein
MPVLSRFFGIVIYMYWRDHMPAHFHAKYQDEEITWKSRAGWLPATWVAGHWD